MLIIFSCFHKQTPISYLYKCIGFYIGIPAGHILKSGTKSSLLIQDLTSLELTSRADVSKWLLFFFFFFVNVIFRCISHSRVEFPRSLALGVRGT